MSGDDLHDPLGYNPAASAQPERHFPWRAIGLGGLAASVAGIVALAYVRDNGMGGEPFAIAKIEVLPKRDPAPAVTSPGSETTASIRTPTAARATAEDIESESGVRVVRQGGGSAPGALIIQVPNELGVQLTAAPDRRLVEKGRFGPLPKLATDGSRPSEIYARPMVTPSSLKPGAPRLALVVGGMGLSQQATQNASAKLPGAVTLAFAPYGVELERQVARVRENGHEVILQVPMEPFDLAENPGPHMLQTTATAEQNIEHLHWLMSRFTGYVGVANFLGAKFLASEAALSPILRETASRGLFYLDDGGVAQSSAVTIAAATGASAVRADIVLDANQKPEAIEAELAKLERLARQKGSAIGIATGLPATVEQVARFARSLEKRGIALTPLSTLAATVPATAANSGR